VKHCVRKALRCSSTILAYFFIGLGFLCTAPTLPAAEQQSPQHHSLIHRQETDSKLVEPRTLSPASPSSSTPTARSPHRKLTKRPGQTIVTEPSAGSTPTTVPPSQSLSAPSRTESRLPTGGSGLAQPAATSSVTTSSVTGTSVSLAAMALSTVKPASASANALASPGISSAVSGGSRGPGGRGMQSLVGEIPGLSQLVTPALSVTSPQSTSPTSSPPPPSSQVPPSTSPSSLPASPAPPTGTGSATLSWTMNSETDLAGYKIYVGTSPGRYTYPGSPIVIGPTSSYIITGLPASQTYYFALSAFNYSGAESALSGEVSKSIY
jgi:hypothetical protein